MSLSICFAFLGGASLVTVSNFATNRCCSRKSFLKNIEEDMKKVEEEIPEIKRLEEFIFVTTRPYMCKLKEAISLTLEDFYKNYEELTANKVSKYIIYRLLNDQYNRYYNNLKQCDMIDSILNWTKASSYLEQRAPLLEIEKYAKYKIYHVAEYIRRVLKTIK